jgi:hypothetical protein
MLVRTDPSTVSVFRIYVGYCAIAVSIVMPWSTASGHKLEDVNNSIDENRDLLEISATTVGQTTLTEGESSGSYEVDIIGSDRLLKSETGQVVGDGRLSFWVFSVGKLGNDAASMA